MQSGVYLRCIMEATVQQVIFTVALCLTGIVSSLVQGNTFRSITDCICQQDIVTYECIVCGLATAWEGTALDSCSGREIALTNRDFMEPIQTIICNGGTIAARGISVKDECFTSQLNVTFNSALQGRTVSCSVDNGTHASEVGIDTLVPSTDPYPSPESIYLTGVSPTGLFFSWNQTRNCPSLSYNIWSENCGRCPNTTGGTSVNCSDFTISSSITLCNFTVQTVICGNSGVPLVGNFSDSVIVNLTVPTIGQVTTFSHYHIIDNGLRGLTVIFSAVNPFIIYEDINGTAITYMVYYSNSDTGEICGSNEINSSFCENGFCSGEFNVSSSSCRPLSDINVTVSAVTDLGEGPQTNPIMEEYRNNLVRVQVISESASINCTFLNVSRGTPTSCNATVTYGQNCQEQMLLNGMKDSENDLLIVISLRRFLEETMSSKYCGFRVNATANTKTVTVEGNLLAISLNFGNPDISRNTIAGVVALVVILVVAIILIVVAFSVVSFICWKRHRKSVTVDITDIISLQSMDTSKPTIIPVPEACNMIEFAKKVISNYDPDSGEGYYQFTETMKEYISSKTQVVLVSEDEKEVCTGRKARKIIGIRDKREYFLLPDLSATPWKYVFIQSSSRIRMLPKGSHFMFYGKPSDDTRNQKRSSTPFKNDEENLIPIHKKYYKLKHVPQECPILDFVKTIEGIAYKSGLGYGFYEFTKPELISYDKQVILMDHDEKLYYGPDARNVIGIGPGQDYDETEDIQPNFDNKRWKRVFIQTRSNIRTLQPNTWFLYCDVASSEMIRVLELFKVIMVPKADEDKRKIIKFAKQNIPYYNPRACYAYYEFTGRNYIIPDRNIMALNKKGELFTGPGVRKLAGISEDHDETKEVDAPDLKDTEWECIFIQGRKAYGRVLEPNTRFLYCEYDYTPEVY